jgi:hypothetical protein
MLKKANKKKKTGDGSRRRKRRGINIEGGKV